MAVASKALTPDDLEISDEELEHETSTDCGVDVPVISAVDDEGCSNKAGSMCSIEWCQEEHWRQFPEVHRFNMWPFRKQFRHNIRRFASFKSKEGERFVKQEQLVIK